MMNSMMASPYTGRHQTDGEGARAPPRLPEAEAVALRESHHKSVHCKVCTSIIAELGILTPESSAYHGPKSLKILCVCLRRATSKRWGRPTGSTPTSRSFKNVQCLRDTNIPVEQQTPQGFFVCDRACRVISGVCRATSKGWGRRTASTPTSGSSTNR